MLIARLSITVDSSLPARPYYDDIGAPQTQEYTLDYILLEATATGAAPATLDFQLYNGPDLAVDKTSQGAGGTGVTTPYRESVSFGGARPEHYDAAVLWRLLLSNFVAGGPGQLINLLADLHGSRGGPGGHGGLSGGPHRLPTREPPSKLPRLTAEPTLRGRRRG